MNLQPINGQTPPQRNQRQNLNSLIQPLPELKMPILMCFRSVPLPSHPRSSQTHQLAVPIEQTGKAAIMSLANGGSIPKFSKYSGVVQWSNSYFLWVNILPSDLRSKNSNRDADFHPNEFLEKGRKMTWFGGSSMRPGSSSPHLSFPYRTPATDSDLTQDLIACGSVDSDEVNRTNRRHGNVCLFVREVGEPYSYFGKVSISEVNLAVKPIQITWTLNHFEELKEMSHFQRILQICRSERREIGRNMGGTRLNLLLTLWTLLLAGTGLGEKGRRRRLQEQS
jgi:hypothetical protein